MKCKIIIQTFEIILKECLELYLYFIPGFPTKLIANQFWLYIYSYPILDSFIFIQEFLYYDYQSLDLIENCQTSSYFLFQEKLYQEPFGPPITNLLTFTVADIIERVFSTYKRKAWCCYADETVIVWPHCINRVNGFQEHLNKYHLNPNSHSQTHTFWYLHANSYHHYCQNFHMVIGLFSSLSQPENNYSRSPICVGV